MYNYRCLLIPVMLVLLVYSLGCDKDDSQVTDLTTEPSPVETPIVAEPVAPQPIVENEVEAGIEAAPVVENEVEAAPVVEEEIDDGFCWVGDVLKPGESCKDGTGDDFTVLENGSGKYLFIVAGKGINLRGNINGKVRSFSAENQGDGTWKIKSVTPK